MPKVFWSFFAKKDHFLAFGLILLVWSAALLHQPGSIWAGSLLRKDLVLALLGLATLVYLISVRLRISPGVVLAVGVAVRLGLLASPPFMSSDVYRYVWDGHVQASGVNPYRYVPSDPALRGLRDGAVYPNINRLEYAHTIYPPAAQAIFLAADGVGYSVVATKFVLFLLETAGMVALWRVLVLAGLPPGRLVVYAWNPLAIWGSAADGHVDAAAVGLVGLALLARCAGRRDGLAGMLLGAAILTKFLPVVIAPALWRRWRWRLPLACAATIAALYACYASVGWQVFGFLPAYTREEGMAQGRGFWLLSALERMGPLPHAAGAAYLAVCVAGLGATAAWMAFVQPATVGAAEVRRVGSNAAILAGGTMMAMSPHYAWYFSWLALFAAIAPWRSVVFLSCAPLVLYADPYHATLSIPTLVFLPTLLLAARDMAVRRPLALGAVPA